MTNIELLEKELKKRNISLQDISTVSRKSSFVYLRLLYAHVARKDNMSYIKIGRLLNRNHSTIIYYCKIFNESLKYDVKFKEFMKEWEEFI